MYIISFILGVFEQLEIEIVPHKTELHILSLLSIFVT